MIRHIVLIRFRPDVTEGKIASLFLALPALSKRLPGVLATAFGRSESPEKIERGYLHGFTIDFTDCAALATYQDDPEHKAFGKSLVAHAQGGIEGILVFDLPVNDVASSD